MTAQGISMYVYKIRVKKNRNFFEIPAALFFILQTKIQKKWFRGAKVKIFILDLNFPPLDFQRLYFVFFYTSLFLS